MRQAAMTLVVMTIIIGSFTLACASKYAKENTPCPNGYDEGDIVTYVANDVQGVILDCQRNIVWVGLGASKNVWKWDNVSEFKDTE